tara:strand:+ start:691 stop:831 length:141 start_codon:yes stop_codon:yes gene_type:complete
VTTTPKTKGYSKDEVKAITEDTFFLPTETADGEYGRAMAHLGSRGR